MACAAVSVGPLCFVCASGAVAGAEVVLLALTDEALGRGHSVVVACPPGQLAERLPPGCAHVPLPELGLGRGPLAWTAVRYLLRSLVAARRIRSLTPRGALVIVNSLLALPAARVARPRGGVVWLAHDVIHRRDQELLIRATRRVLRCAVAVSAAVAAPLRQLGLPVLVSRNGVQWPAPFLGREPRVPAVVGALARLTPWKGQRVLLEAVARLPGVRLELAGGYLPCDASYVAELRERAEREDLRGRVVFLGEVDRTEALGRWDVMVSASTAPEATPLAVLEAQSMGVPVVGTAHGNPVELLAAGGGVLVPPGDPEALAGAIHRVLTEPRLRRRMVQQGRLVAEQHDSSLTLPAMLDALLGEVAGAPGPV